MGKNYNYDENMPAPRRKNGKKAAEKRAPADESGYIKVKKRKIWPIVLSIIGICVLAVAAYIVILLNFYKPTVDHTPTFDTSHETDEQGQSKPVTVKETKYNFLVMGHDRAAGLTDVIMLISYDTADQSVNIMQIPRDTYVELDDYYYHKINGAYSYFTGVARDEKSPHPEIDGCRKFADLLEKSLCIKIYYTAVMDLDGFGNIVDAVGGVDMYVPQRMYYSDPAQNLYINLKEGYQHLDGNTAEQFVRFRSGYANADIGRGNAQKLFMTAFIKKLKDSISLTDLNKLTSLATNVANSVTTDLSVNEIVFFGKSFMGYGSGESVQLDKVNMLTLPGQAFYDGLSYYMMNKDAVSSVINEYFNIYDYDITPSFDKNKIFVNENSENAKKTYSMPKEELDMVIYNAEQLDKDGLK